MDPERLKKLNELFERHTISIDVDRAEAVKILTERARLLMYGSLAVMAGAITAAWNSEKIVCIAPLGWGVALCFAGAGAAWIAFQLTENSAYCRIRLKQASFEQSRLALLGDSAWEGEMPSVKGAADAVLNTENWRRDVVHYGFCSTSMGTAILLVGALHTLAGKACFVFAGRLSFLNGVW